MGKEEVKGEDLKNLQPEERIKRLKELEAQKKKEIEEAEKAIKESESEISERIKWKEMVPIPQVAKAGFGESADERLILEACKGKKKEETKETEETNSVDDILGGEEKKEKGVDLELLAQERVDLPLELLNSQYTIQLSQRPMNDLYQEMSGIKKTVEEKGYTNQEEQKRANYLASAVEKKVEAAEGGKYSFTESVARATSVFRQMSSEVRGMYHSGSGVKYQS